MNIWRIYRYGNTTEREFKSDKTFNRWLNVQLLVMGVSNKDHTLKRRESLGYVNTRQGLPRININQQVRISYNLTSDKISVLPLAWRTE